MQADEEGEGANRADGGHTAACHPICVAFVKLTRRNGAKQLFHVKFFFLFFLFKAPKHTHPPQTPTRTALAHSTRTKSTDLVYGSVSLSATGDRCGAERWIALARQRASSVKPSMREFSRQMTAETWRS